MRKVMLTQAQINALEILRAKCKFNEGLIVSEYMTMRIARKGFTNELTPLKALTNEQLVNAVIHGYTLKLSPKERIKNLYDHYEGEVRSKDYDRMPGGYSGMNAIIEVLNILDIQVEGVPNEISE